MTDQTEFFTVNIDELDERGLGRSVIWRENELGNKRKLSLTIPNSLPGEKVRVAVERPDRRRWRTRPGEIIEAHADRVTPRCPHFSICGGCVWQHWDYAAQTKEKTNRVKQYLAKEGFAPDVVQETIGMDEPWFYRNKMELTFAVDGSLGFHEQGNFRKIVPIETCYLMSDDMKRIALEIGRWAKEYQLPGYNKMKHEGLLRHVMVRQSFATGELMIAIFATEGPNDIPGLSELRETIAKRFPFVKSFLWMENRNIADRAQAEDVHLLAGRDFIYDELMGFRFRLWYDTFFQTNPTQAEKLVELALEMAEADESETMIDLFCGVGTFSLPFAKQVKELIGIEIVETSIESAKRNASDNGISNTHFIARDARRGMDEVVEQFGTPDVLLLDPPRSGAGGKVMRKIGRTKANRIVYVSCNPETFAKDIKQLEPFGYRLEKVQPIDLFPQTYHVECVTLLIRE